MVYRVIYSVIYFLHDPIGSKSHAITLITYNTSILYLCNPFPLYLY